MTDKPIPHSSLPALAQDAKGRIVEEILRLQFPSEFMMLTIGQSLPSGSMDHSSHFQEASAKLQTQRERLLKLSEETLHQQQELLLVARAVEKRKAQTAKMAAKESVKFYNHPDASANLEIWAKSDYWTFDESIALLLGKEPTIVSWAAIQQELTPSTSWFLPAKPAQLSEFVQRYMALRSFAERHEAMARRRLRPVDVVAWAFKTDAADLPEILLQLINPERQDQDAFEAQASRPDLTPGANPEATPTRDPSPAPPDISSQPKILKRAALLKKYLSAWDTLESDLSHGNENGLSKTAKAPGHGMWFEEPALEWARQNGKLVESLSVQSPFMHGTLGQLHRMRK
jgi:hypothetical protein